MPVANLTEKGLQKSERYKHLTLFCMIAGIAAVAIIVFMSFLPKLPYIISDMIGGPIEYLFFILSGPAYLLGQVFGISVFTLAFEKNELFIPLLLTCFQWLIVWLIAISLIISERYWKVLLAVGAAVYAVVCIVSLATYLLLEFRM